MLKTLMVKTDIIPFFTTDLLENGYGVLINDKMPTDSFLAIDIDEYYHSLCLTQTPAIADLLLVANELTAKKSFHIYIIEMKNIKRAASFTVKNLYAKFETAIEDFMKFRYSEIFLNKDFLVTQCKLYFISDVYKIQKKGYTKEEADSFLKETKIGILQNMRTFTFRNFSLKIEYELPNPILAWY